jgi:hypothetical protein
MTFNMDKVPSVADIKRRMAEQKQAQESYKRTVDKNFFPFWEMDDGAQAVVRILPDANYDNPLTYMVNSMYHRLMIDGEERRVTCPKTFGNAEDCPICDLSQRYYRDNDKDKGRYYWRNKTSFVKVLVISDPLNVKDEDGNDVDFTGRVCTTTFGKQLQDALDESLAELPAEDSLKPICAFEFTIKKRKMAGDGDKTYSSYAFSRITSGPSDIPAEYAENLELMDLSELLPERPPLEKVQNYLDAHLGVAEFKYGPQQGSNAASTTDAETTATSAADAIQAAKAASTTEAPAPAPVEEAAAPQAEAPAPKAEPESSDSVPDEDLIAGILNRNRG